MRYTKIKWIHDFPREPVWIYEEIDENGWEQRKIEVFPDGSLGRADKREEVGGTRLAIQEKIPSLLEIGSDPQFEGNEISAEEFEAAWSKAVIEGRDIANG